MGALCLSVALPVATRAYQGDLVLNWCEGLLPEGEMRTTLEQHPAVRRGDKFSLLAVLGRDCAGAVSFSGDDEGASRRHATAITSHISSARPGHSRLVQSCSRLLQS